MYTLLGQTRGLPPQTLAHMHFKYTEYKHRTQKEEELNKGYLRTMRSGNDRVDISQKEKSSNERIDPF